MKNIRQEKIIEIIMQNAIDTQEKLLSKLREYGFKVTQATVSRDIKELRLVKVQERGGRYRYTLPMDKAKQDLKSRFYTIFKDSSISVDYAQNIVVIKCESGMAQAVCAAFDAVGFDMIVGTLAGDDTILIIASDNESAGNLTNELKKHLDI